MIDRNDIEGKMESLDAEIQEILQPKWSEKMSLFVSGIDIDIRSAFRDIQTSTRVARAKLAVLVVDGVNTSNLDDYKALQQYINPETPFSLGAATMALSQLILDGKLSQEFSPYVEAGKNALMNFQEIIKALNVSPEFEA